MKGIAIKAHLGPEPNSIVVDITLSPRELYRESVIWRRDHPCARAVRRAEINQQFIIVHLRSIRAVEAFARAEARAGGWKKRSRRVFPLYAPIARKEDLVQMMLAELVKTEPQFPLPFL